MSINFRQLKVDPKGLGQWRFNPLKKYENYISFGPKDKPTQ